MIVQIQSADNNNNNETPKWALIELNGELVPPTDASKGQNDENEDNLVESDRVELGSLKFTSEVSIQYCRVGWRFIRRCLTMPSLIQAFHVLQGTPIIIIGSHELKGEVVTLKEPFCVMNKKRKGDENVEYTVVGVVTKKLLFTNYPKTIMR